MRENRAGCGRQRRGLLDTAAPAGIPDRPWELVEGGGADRDDLLTVAIAVGAFADRAPDRVAVGAYARDGGEQAAFRQIRLQLPGRGGAADDPLEPAVRKQTV